MPVSICQRCQHVNPDHANYCYFDGIALQAQQNAAVQRLPNEFAFPSGRRCNTYDDLAQGCQEEWASARNLLMGGVFAQFFRSCHRADLVRAADDAKAQVNPDMGLMTFLTALPGTRTGAPKLDLHPRRILAGNLVAGESKTASLTVSNHGQGMLQGTVAITEGQDWLSLSESGSVLEMAVQAVREQIVKLKINTRGVAAGQTYGAKLTVVTNGGVVEIPLRMDLVAQPYPTSPFQGARTPRELAEKMRLLAKATVPVLESGDISRWFAVNGWTYPVAGTPIKGIAGVQQFFEGMGLSKPPPVQLSQTEFRYKCKHNESLRAQVTLQTKVKKWVYAHVTSDSPWLRVLNPQISGPQQASVSFEIDTHAWNRGPAADGTVTFIANGGQKLLLKVFIEFVGASAAEKPKPPAPVKPPAPIISVSQPKTTAPTSERTPATPPPVELPSPGVKWVPAILTTIVVCLLLRLVLVPVVDLAGRSSAADAAARKMEIQPTVDSPLAQTGGWLALPWLPILIGGEGTFSADIIQPGSKIELKMLDFRHYYASYFIRWLVVRTWWLGAVLGAVLVLLRGGRMLELPWGIIAGAATGLGVSATLAAFFLVVEVLPHIIWHVTFAGHGGLGNLILWCFLSVFCWLLFAVGVGMIIAWLGPLRRMLIEPFQGIIADQFRRAGLTSLAHYWSPS